MLFVMYSSLWTVIFVNSASCYFKKSSCIQWSIFGATLCVFYVFSTYKIRRVGYTLAKFYSNSISDKTVYYLLYTSCPDLVFLDC